MENNATNPQAPLCLALVLADDIYRDTASGKRTILGTFSVIFSPEMPVTQGQLAVYCALTDGHGKTTIDLKLVRIDNDNMTDEPIAEARGEVDFVDPRMVVELDLKLRGIVFPSAGEYRFQIIGNGELLMERRLVVLHAIPEGEENG